MNKHFSKNAFTLVELLVVITIIGILAGIALPVFQKVQINAEQTKVLANGKQIGLALKLFANDFEGAFPTLIDQAGAAPGGAVVTANDALANLVPNYVPAEKTFFVKKSAWNLRAGSIQPGDEKYTLLADRLALGENHWAYVSLLNDTSNGSFPLIADGFAENKPGEYTIVATDKGGVWEAKKAVVIRVDQSGKVENVQTATQKVFGPTGGAANADIFATSATWLSATQLPLNPL